MIDGYHLLAIHYSATIKRFILRRYDLLQLLLFWFTPTRAITLYMPLCCLTFWFLFRRVLLYARLNTTCHTYLEYRIMPCYLNTARSGCCRGSAPAYRVVASHLATTAPLPRARLPPLPAPLRARTCRFPLPAYPASPHFCLTPRRTCATRVRRHLRAYLQQRMVVGGLVRLACHRVPANLWLPASFLLQPAAVGSFNASVLVDCG